MFDDIRPYNDSEAVEALARIAQSREFEHAAAYLFSNRPIEDLRHKLRSVRSIDQLQTTVMVQVIRRIIQTTISQFTYSGIEHLNAGQNYLFISNHRDIVLDAYLLQYILFQHHMPLCQITFGENLMSNPIIADLGRCNNMFKVQRGGTPKEFYSALHHLSCYISHTLMQGKNSIWIAQRNGRTKDGNDRTDPALIKMLAMYDHHITPTTLLNLHIVPVTISYEWEPCDTMKALELCKTRRDGTYRKAHDEDLRSIISGITTPKGHVHITIGKPIGQDDLSNCPHTGNPLCNTVTRLLDSRINQGYHPMPTNHIAHHILHPEEDSQQYDNETIQHFLRHIDPTPCCDNLDPSLLRTQLLHLYAAPIEKLKIENVS